MEPPKNSDQSKLANRIQDRILVAGYTSQDHFARSIALPRSTLYKLLKGDLDPRLSTLRKIADGLDFSLSELFESAVRNSSSLRATVDGLHPLHKSGRRGQKTLTVKVAISGDEIPDWLVQACASGSKESPKPIKKKSTNRK